MTLDPRTPVLVGVGTVQQHDDDFRRAEEALTLMTEAARRAGVDAGAAELLGRLDAVFVPDGTWGYGDPGRKVAAEVGSSGVHSVVARIGVLQQSLLSRAATGIAAGDLDVVLVVGGEAKFRARRAEAAGETASETDDDGVPDVSLEPAEPVLPAIEIERGLGLPANQYAVMESARRYARRVEPAAATDDLARWWSRFSAVAAANPDAWRRDVITAEDLAGATGANSMVATPYTRWHCSQWNVDQAAALLMCSHAMAERFGVAASQRVYPLVTVESNAAIHLSERAELHRSPAVRIAGERARELGGVALGSIRHRDLYSCFPVAVRIQLDELDLAAEPVPTVTGGMSFAGGPLNNSALMALAALARRLRGDPGSVGLATSISGMVTKFGLGTWSSEPPRDGLRAADVSDLVATRTATRCVQADYRGRAVVAGYTVQHDRGRPWLGVVVVDTPAGHRTVATTTDSATIAGMLTGEFCGSTVTVSGAEFHA